MFIIKYCRIWLEQIDYKTIDKIIFLNLLFKYKQFVV